MYFKVKVTILSFVSETYDLVVIVGALSVGQVPVAVIRELWQATKPGVSSSLIRQFMQSTPVLSSEYCSKSQKTHCSVNIVHLCIHMCMNVCECVYEVFCLTMPSLVTGGYVCMTTRGNPDNHEYKTELECMMRMMEEEKRWTRVTITEVIEWERAVDESGYISGAVYLYKRT